MTDEIERARQWDAIKEVLEEASTFVQKSEADGSAELYAYLDGAQENLYELRQALSSRGDAELTRWDCVLHTEEKLGGMRVSKTGEWVRYVDVPSRGDAPKLALLAREQAIVKRTLMYPEIAEECRQFFPKRCGKNMGNDLLVIPCDLPEDHPGPCERNVWPVPSRGDAGTPQEFLEALEKLLISAVRIAILRHDLRPEADITLDESMTDERAQELAQDAAWAVQGEGTCSDEPLDEWKAVLKYAEAALAHREAPTTCSSTTPHAAHTYGGRPMQLCKGIPKDDCDGKVTHPSGQCVMCKAYHPVADREGEQDTAAPIKLIDEREVTAEKTYWQTRAETAELKVLTFHAEFVERESAWQKEREALGQLSLEISNLAHNAWTDPKNAEYLFREIGKRAHKIGGMSAAPQPIQDEGKR